MKYKKDQDLFVYTTRSGTSVTITREDKDAFCEQMKPRLNTQTNQFEKAETIFTKDYVLSTFGAEIIPLEHWKEKERRFCSSRGTSFNEPPRLGKAKVPRIGAGKLRVRHPDGTMKIVDGKNY